MMEIFKILTRLIIKLIHLLISSSSHLLLMLSCKRGLSLMEVAILLDLPLELESLKTKPGQREISMPVTRQLTLLIHQLIMLLSQLQKTSFTTKQLSCKEGHSLMAEATQSDQHSELESQKTRLGMMETSMPLMSQDIKPTPQQTTLSSQPKSLSSITTQLWLREEE